MSKRKSTASGAAVPQVLPLPAECLIGNGESLREALIGAAQAKAVTLDASQVQRVDTACLQLLTAFVSERRAANRAVGWAGVPALLTERAQLLGLSALLAFDGVAGEGAA